jgi:hypothetical protein
MHAIRHTWIYLILLSLILTGCVGLETQGFGTSAPSITVLPDQASLAEACPVTQPAWLQPPDDAAVSNPPEPGYYFVNSDRSIMASAWWAENPDYHLRASKEGEKVGWFRPAGADLEITGRRIDGEAPPLGTHVPCCYPTQFQSSGLYFPTPGCWEISATAAGSLISFVVRVEP